MKRYIVKAPVHLMFANQHIVCTEQHLQTIQIRIEIREHGLRHLPTETVLEKLRAIGYTITEEPKGEYYDFQI